MIFYQHFSSTPCLVGAAALLSALAWFPSSNAFFTATTSAGTRGPLANVASPSLVPRGNKEPVLLPLGAPCCGGSKGLLNGSLCMSKYEDARKSDRKDHLMKVVPESNAMVTVDPGKQTIDDFIYTEALLLDFANSDDDERAAFKRSRQALSNFISDVNTLQVQKENDYLAGSAYFPESGRTLIRDEDSSDYKLSNQGIVRLLEASVKEMSVMTRSLGPQTFSKYKETKTQTANSFNLDTVIDTCTDLVSSFDQSSIGGISKAAKAIGDLLKKSTETQSSTNPVSTLAFTCIVDYDPLFDEVTASLQLILFEFNFESFVTIEQNKGTERADVFVDTSTTVENSRSGVNLDRLTKYYPPNDNDQNLNENPTVPGGNVATLLAPGAYLKELQRPDLEFLPDLREKILAETNVRCTRHFSGDYVPQAMREPGYKVIRTNPKRCSDSLDTRS